MIGSGTFRRIGPRSQTLTRLGGSSRFEHRDDALVQRVIAEKRRWAAIAADEAQSPLHIPNYGFVPPFN